ncbi:MAG: hypothetical protein MJA82_20340 [Clostridia bacterium]|nr:hypothetical protein [Clostridia bacterium]
MNTFILGSSSNYYGKYKEKLGIRDKASFDIFLKKLENNDVERNCGGMVQTRSCSKIAKTLRCFKIEFKEDYHDNLIIDDLSSINAYVFSGKKTNMEVLLWVTKGIVEELADKIDENIRYGGFIDNEFLCNVRDFFLNTYITIKGYELLNDRKKGY